MIKEASKGFIALIVGAFVVTIAGLLIASMSVFGWGLWSNATANFRGQVSARNQINGNGAYRIAAYNHFYDLCQQVQSKELSLHNLEQELATTTDPQRKLVLEASVDALRNSLADDITQYNADSRKTATAGQFRASDLPARIDPNDIYSKEVTSCHA